MTTPGRTSITARLTGMITVEHEFEVPLDHAHPDGPTIEVFAREVADPDGPDRPYLVFLQGGPGFEAARPTGNPMSPAWLGRALADFRVLLLDQRGTGRSTPVGADLTAQLDPEQQAGYLANFRADSIVADAEVIREALGVSRWSLLGQSFGGFCALTYLSKVPDSLREVFFTGGVPPVGRDVDEVYSATHSRMLERNARYYARYPGDRERVRALVAELDDAPRRLPDGGLLTSRRFRQAGNALGMSDGLERLHHLVELPLAGPAFGHDVNVMQFERNPLYALLNEACVADGGVTGWAAARTMPGEFAAEPALFTGEHIFEWMFTDYAGLVPFADVARLLAAREWPRLYDEDVLRATNVPCAAAVYADDPYVESEFSLQTAQLVPGLRTWLTNEYDHNGLRADGARILGRLIDLARDRA